MVANAVWPSVTPTGSASAVTGMSSVFLAARDRNAARFWPGVI